MSSCGLSYQKTTNNNLIESELNCLQQRFQMNVEALDCLLSNYNRELINLKDSLHRDAFQNSLARPACDQEEKTTAKNKVKMAPKPLPKPSNTKFSVTVKPNHRVTEFCQSFHKSLAEKTSHREIEAAPNDISATRSKNPGHTELLKRSYSQLVNYISSTEDIAAKLFQEEHLSKSELETIQEARSMTKANENLLNILISKPAEVYRAFLDELQRTRQSHVLSMLANANNESFDFCQYSKLIRQHYIYLTECMEVTETGLLCHLMAANVLTDREKTKIETESNRYRQVESLLGVIGRKSSTDFDLFLEALANTNQKHIADVLQGIDSSSETNIPKTKIVSEYCNEKRHIEQTSRKHVQINQKRKLADTWVTSVGLSFSLRLDISTKILAMCRKNSRAPGDVNACHIENLLDGFVRTRNSILTLEDERNVAVDMNFALADEKQRCEVRLAAAQKESSQLHIELDSKMAELLNLKAQETDSRVERDRLETQLREAESTSERLKLKLQDAVKDMRRRQDSVTGSDEFKRLKIDRDRLAIQLKKMEKELRQQKGKALRENVLDSEELARMCNIQQEAETRLEELRNETESRILELTRKSREDENALASLRKEIQLLGEYVSHLEGEKHQLLNELAIEREKNSKNQDISLKPKGSDITRFSASHLSRLDIPGIWVEGAAILEDRLYLACRSCSSLIVCNSQRPHSRLYSIQIPGMMGPIDVVASQIRRCLYVSDSGARCVWRVSTDCRSEKWLVNVSWPYTLSITTDDRILITKRPSSLEIYEADATLAYTIQLPETLLDSWHATETQSGTYLISHGDKLTQFHGLTEVTKEGQVVRSYGGPPGRKPEELDRPYYMAPDSLGNVIVGDHGNRRVVVLDSSLNFVEVLLNKGDNGMENPSRIYCCDNGCLLVINAGVVDFYSLTHSLLLSESSNL